MTDLPIGERVPNGGQIENEAGDGAFAFQGVDAGSLSVWLLVDDAIEGQRKSIVDDPSYAWGYFDLARFLCSATPSRTEDARVAAKKLSSYAWT